ncbi:NUDIX hydrolase [Tianweitania sediminis]|jgi:8-oxo-dGTP pyrophosphatase MutT (NUDIX family)|uniref:NUDIX hydrolase n=2 Tax=Tianweitania sediminis TaxID=1502156 RepID=A0A8J7QZV4_9HYPH|nr:NUDIX hydrolase [Tianweitania sediminis]
MRRTLKARLQSLLGRRPCHVQVAALPWRRTADGIEVMLITSRRTRRWVVPKGWPEGDEHFWDAAAREAAEEAGLSGTISDASLGSYFYNKIRTSGEELRCEVKVYPLEVEQVAEKWRERRQRTRRWMPPHEAAQCVKEPELAALIGSFSVDPSQPLEAVA